MFNAKLIFFITVTRTQTCTDEQKMQRENLFQDKHKKKLHLCISIYSTSNYTYAFLFILRQITFFSHFLFIQFFKKSLKFYIP